MRPTSPTLVVTTALDLGQDQHVESILAQLPYIPSIMDSVTHVSCSPRVCGVKSDDVSSVRILRVSDKSGHLINGGSNICITGDLHTLLDVTDITPMDISVALDGAPSTADARITKHGLLPLTLSDNTTYFQTCFYCANTVETIISPAAIPASSDVFYYWHQEGCKDPSVPGRIQFTSRDGLASMHFNLEQHEGLYYCSTDIFTVDHDPVRVLCRWTHVPRTMDIWRPPPWYLPTSNASQVELEVWLL
jgi:hypothetical protein